MGQYSIVPNYNALLCTLTWLVSRKKYSHYVKYDDNNILNQK